MMLSSYYALVFCSFPSLPMCFSRLCHTANKERHVSLVAPQQHDERPQGTEGREGARKGQGGDSTGLYSSFGQGQEGFVFGLIQN